MFDRRALLVLVCAACHAGPGASAGEDAASSDSSSTCGTGSSGSPQVTNLDDGTQLGYSLALLSGTAGGTEVSIASAGEVIAWPVVAGHYKALVPLAAGANTVQLTACGHTLALRLAFQPQTNDYYVRVVYVEGSNGGGTFDAPPGTPNTEADGVVRVQTAAWMWQTFYAEAMQRQGFGRTTFRLLLDANQRPVVTVARSTKTTAQLRAMTPNQIWSQLYTDFGALPNREQIKDVLILGGVSHFDPATAQLRAGGALGGGHEAMFHGADLFTWPPSVADVVPHFLDLTKVDATQLSDDSAGRHTYWANDTTTSGAVIHELGHTLGFAHNTDYTSIMYRGFDTWNRFFMASEPASDASPGIPQIADSDLPDALVDYEAMWLAYSRWFTQVPVADPGGAVTITQSGDTVTVSSPNKLRDIIFWDDNLTFDADELKTAPPSTKTYSAAQLRVRFPTATRIGLLVMDGAGKTQSFDVM